MPPSRTKLHPSLDRRNIERLPLKQRLYASAALDITEPPSRLGNFIDDHLREKTAFDISVILPIVYANLAGFNPPDPEDLEERATGKLEDSTDLAASVLRPIYAIELLSAVVVDTPSAAMPTLWPHVWRWTAHFRAHHPYYIRGPGFMEDVGLYISLFTVRILLPCLRSEKQSFRDQVMSTPGLVGAVFYTWSRIAADQREDTGFDAVKKHFYEGLFDYLDHASRDSQQNRFWLDLNDVAEAAGSVDDLAATILRTIYTDLGRRSEDEQARGLRTMLRLIDLLSPSAQGHTPFWNALLEQHVSAGIVVRTCACFSSLERATQRHAFFSITRSLKYSTDPAQLAAAVDAGLLLLLSKATTQTSPVDLAELGWLSLLSQGLVHRAVVAAVQRAFPDLQHVMSKPQLRQSPYPPYYRPFIDFIALYRLRFEILEKVRGRESTCSSPQCTSQLDAEDTKIRRCGGCCDTFYCSRESQRADWIAGHRAVCSSLAPSLTVLRDPPRLAIQREMKVLLPGNFAAAVPPPPAGTPDFSKLMFGRNAAFFRAVVESDARGAQTRAEANAAKSPKVKSNGTRGYMDGMHVVVDYTGEKGVGATTVMRRRFCGEDVPEGYTVVVVPLGQYAARCLLNARGLDDTDNSGAGLDEEEVVVEQVDCTKWVQVRE